MKHEISDYNELYTKADTKDSTLFAEQKSNILLVNSEHYKQVDKTRRRGDIVDDNGKSKVRITKNHIYRIMQKIKNGIMGLSPDLKPYPANPNELSDKKVAELYDSVLEFGKNRYKLNDKKEEWCEDYCDIGEVAVKVYWDKNKGDIRAYQQIKDEEGNPIFVDAGKNPTTEPASISKDPITGMPIEVPNKPLPDKDKPIFSGDFCFDTILPFNLLRDPDAESMDESPYLIVRKMREIDDVKALIAEDDPERDEKLEYIQKSAETTYKVFDTDKGSYDDAEGQVMLREFYFRPCIKYPRGWYAVTTEKGVLFEGELPFSVFPIAYRGFKKIQTSARARSLIKILRPLQYELNRNASMEVETSIIHGHDRIVTPPGGKISQGALLPGLRQVHAVGQPTIIPGRTGEQFAPPQQRILQEMYQMVDEEYESQDNPNQMDATSLLYRSLTRKAKYGKYAKGFQEFLKDVYWIYLRLAKHYYDESWYIKATGRNEKINFAEFKSADELSVQIRLIEDNEDSESLLGKSIQFNHILQYVGKDLPKEALGKVLSNLPYANKDQVFSDLTVDSKNIENDLLALDRGETRQATMDDENHLYVKALTARMKQPDFKILSPEIQQNYATFRDEHRAIQAEKEKQILMAQQQAIPTGGVLCKVDYYTMQNGKQVRATFPMSALQWLEEKLATQGLAQERLESMASADQMALAQQMMMANQQVPPGALDQGVMNANGPVPGQQF